MPDRMQKAQPPLKFIPERFNPFAFAVLQRCLPWVMWLRLRPWLPAGIAAVETVNLEQLVQLYAQFQMGKIRLLLAFRHVEVDDPLSLMYLLSRAMPQSARRQGILLKPPLHAHFLYDRGMTLWAGDWLGEMFSLLGGVPIHRGKRLDRQGLRTIRSLFLNGTIPLMAAPEGATNGHSQRVSPLEPGVAQLSFWCAQDLEKANRPETVWILPIGIQYHYTQPPWKELNRLLNRLEQDMGLSVQAIDASNWTGGVDPTALFYQRLLRLAEQLLNRMEGFYRRFSHQESQETSESLSLTTRLHRVLDRALQMSEQHFNLAAEGTIIERCRRLEEAIWNDIYREDLPDLQQLSPFDRGLANWIAAEAELRGRHMRLVESFVAVSEDYVESHPSAERMAEMALLMFDLVARIKGDHTPARPRLGWRRSRITIGEPISISDRYPAYTLGRSAAKQAVNQLTQDLQDALEALIV